MTEHLLPLVYDELRQLAAAQMANERLDHTLQPTALVHEAYLRLVVTDEARHWNSRKHFFGAAAEAMRRILVDQAREQASEKRGGNHHRVELDDLSDQTPIDPALLLDLSDGLNSVRSSWSGISLSDDIATRFGKRLREIRKRSGLSQEQLGADAGLARNFISMVETGERNVTLATVEKLAIALKCRMADLMPDAED